MDVLAAVAMSVSVKPNSAIICPGFTILFPAFRSLALGCQIREQAVMTHSTKELPADNGPGEQETCSRQGNYGDILRISSSPVTSLGCQIRRSSELRNEMCKPFPGCLRGLGAAEGQASLQMAASTPLQPAT